MVLSEDKVSTPFPVELKTYFYHLMHELESQFTIVEYLAMTFKTDTTLSKFSMFYFSAFCIFKLF